MNSFSWSGSWNASNAARFANRCGAPTLPGHSISTLTIVAALWTSSYLLAIGTILASAVGYGVIMTGESSDLPGTAGKDNKNVPT